MNMTLQRATIVNLIFFEEKAIKDYSAAIRKEDNVQERAILEHILKEEKEHKVELEGMLKRCVTRKGQTDITKLLTL